MLKRDGFLDYSNSDNKNSNGKICYKIRCIRCKKCFIPKESYSQNICDECRKPKTPRYRGHYKKKKKVK